jgi:1-acyl-sn-glycerol-3-phosphate acyltransferase
MKWFWKLYWRVTGWKVEGVIPYNEKKLLFIVGPHTSWKDVLVGLAARSVLNFQYARFLGKKELFDGPFGWLFRRWGGTPVDRFSSHGIVNQVVDVFKNNDRIWLAMSPEGTRKKVEKLRTGFYHIAKSAEIPIQMVAMDFSKKLLVFSSLMYTSNDENMDFDIILDFFSNYVGAVPEYDLRHFKKIK